MSLFLYLKSSSKYFNFILSFLLSLVHLITLSSTSNFIDLPPGLTSYLHFLLNIRVSKVSKHDFSIFIED